MKPIIDQVRTIRKNLEGKQKIEVEVIMPMLNILATLARFIEMSHFQGEGDRYLIRDTKAALSLMEKLTKAGPGDIIQITAEEHKEAERIIKL